jgi:hypothetical protein
MRRRALGAGVLTATLLLGSCLRDAFAPGIGTRAQLGIAPRFETTGARTAIVDFDRVRVTILRPLTSRRPVVDTVLAFPPGADSIELAVQVALEASREEFLVYVRLITALGDTVFRNDPYPQSLVAVAGKGGTVLDALLKYVGVGSNAVGIVFTTPDTLVTFDDTLSLGAVAVGADQLPIAGTPVEWSSLDALRVAVPDGAVGRVHGGSERGPARIVARLLTGPADTLFVTAQPPAALLTMTSGDAQQGAPGSLLSLPVRVRVTAADGMGVRVPVRFRALTPGGSVRDSVVASDATGYAETYVQLAGIAGVQSFEAGVPGVTAVPFTALALTNVATVAVSATASTLDALGANAQFTAVARDGTGGTLAVPITWSSSDTSVVRIDSLTGQAAAVGNGTAVITATAEGVQGSTLLSVSQVATQLSYLVQPTDIIAGAPISPGVEVKALDANGNVALNYIASFSVALADSVTCPATLQGTRLKPATAGVVRFDDLVLARACPGLQLVAASGPLSTGPSSSFSVTAAAAAVISSVSGNGQSGTVGSMLGGALDVLVTDQYLNPIPGHPVNWITLSGGQIVPLATTTDGAGRVTASWTLGTVAGLQTVDARAGGLPGSPARFTATATPGAAARLVFRVAPGETVVLQPITPAVEVAAADQYGNPDPTWANQISVEIDQSTDPTSGAAVLGGVRQLAPVGGVAAFADLTVDLPANGFSLLAKSGSLPDESSQPFNVLSLPAGPVFAGDSTDGITAVSGVFRATPDGSVRARLSDRGVQGDVHPRWDRDRTRVAFTADDRGLGTNMLYVVDQAGTPVAEVVSDTSSRRPRWNRDGTHLAFECGPKFAQNDVCVMQNVARTIPELNRLGDGLGKTVVTDFDNRLDGPAAFAWDPQDPNALVVVRDGLDAQSDPVSTLYLVRADGQLIKILAGPLVDPQRQQPLKITGTLDWSPDGTWIVFAARDPLAVDLDAPTGQRLYAIDRSGEVLRELTKGIGGAFDSHPVISPDGRQVLFIRVAGLCADYWMVEIETGAERQVSEERWCDFNVGVLGHDWSPDGKDIVLVGSEPQGDSSNFGIYAVPATTTAATYRTDRRLIGRGADPGAAVRDLQPSWRP